MKKEINFKKVFNQLLMITFFIIPFIAAADGWHNKAMGEEQQNLIKSISPENAAAGQTITLSIQLDESLGTPPIPPSDVVPEKVTINSIEGTNIQRNNYVISAVFSIPATESIGKKDVSIQFAAPPDNPNLQAMVSTKVSAFEIVDDSGNGENPDDPNGGDTSDYILSLEPDSANTGDNLTLSIQLNESLGSPPIPPSDVIPELVKIGDIEATSIQRSNFIITAVFSIPDTAYPGQMDLSVQFGAPPDQPNADPIIIIKSSAFEIISNAAPGSLIVNIKPDTASSEGAMWKIENGSWQNSGVTVSNLTIGIYKVYFGSISGWNTPSSQNVTISSNQTSTLEVTYEELGDQTLSYPIVDTNQSECFDNNGSISSCSNGQDGLYTGFNPNYTDNGDGTITDNITGLMWQQDPGEKMTYEEAVNNASTFNLAGYNDWRLPTIKELYSLILFTGDTSIMIPFIDNNYFIFEFGDTTIGERLIDAQYASSTEYVSTTMNGNHTMFGVNFADGRIKGYPTEALGDQTEGKKFFVSYVRGTTSYGINMFKDNGDTTITDNSTGLMWTQGDSQVGLLWEEALDYCENLTTAEHNDWRLPNVKELQSIVDYSRSPDTTQTPAIDPMFNSTSITNEKNQNDYPFYWSSTTHLTEAKGASASYVSFGRAMGYMENQWMDVHGAGAQRSDPKTGNPDDYTTGHGYQGDAIRIYNYVRCVRDAEITSEPKTGVLIVNIFPQEAVEDNMQWKVDDGDWHNSGDTVLDLSVGKHNVSFKPGENWIAPVDKTVTITDGKTTTINVTYISNSSPETCNPGDLDSNGKINLKDVIILLQKFVNMNYSD